MTEEIGEHAVNGWHYRLYRTRRGLRLIFADRYRFDLHRDGREIVWYPDPESTQENVRALLIGPLLAITNFLSGALCLHGSAVAIGGQGVAFLAGKHHGKSTLSLALASAGARLLTDDTLVVDLAPSPHVRPGVHSVRLWDDAASLLRAGVPDGVLVDGVKKTLTALPDRMLQTSPVPFAAIYLLESVRAAPNEPAVRRLLQSGAAAAIQMLGHLKLPQTLLGPEAAAAQLRRVAVLAAAVPVYRLPVARDFERLPETVATILRWHDGPTTGRR